LTRREAHPSDDDERGLLAMLAESDPKLRALLYRRCVP
jgi:hypothetical protein